MSIASFSLVNKIPLNLVRISQGHYQDGEWVEGIEEVVEIMANVQPFSYYQVSLMPESDRTRNWLRVFSSETIRPKVEGSNGYGGDRFLWDGEWYQVMAVKAYKMNIRDHFEAKAVRIEKTPN